MNNRTGMLRTGHERGSATVMPGQIKDEKQRLRRIMLEKRRSHSAEDVAVWAQQMNRYFSSWPVYRSSNTIMFYLAMPDEPPTEALILDALGCGKRVCVPLLGEKYGEMAAASIQSLDCLIAGNFGLKMPPADTATILELAEIDLIVVPAVAFDRHGNRLGMGAGYYDRFLAGSPRAVLLGMTWECQLVASIPNEEYDVRMQYLLTEKGILACR